MSRRRPVAAMVLVVALLVGCGGSTGAATTEVADAAPTVAPVLPTGREAIAAAVDAGQPFVLWFWGAH